TSSSIYRDGASFAAMCRCVAANGTSRTARVVRSRSSFACAISERSLHLLNGPLTLLRPDVRQILCAAGVFAGPHEHAVLFAEGDVFALDHIPFLLLGDALLCRCNANGDIEEERYAQSCCDSRDAVTPIVHPTEGVHRRAPK